MKKLIAYHGKPDIKNTILAQLRAHYDADEIIKGTYWEGGKGCAVGCTIHSRNHAEYETAFGIPRVLAHLEDAIFEALPNRSAKEWPIKFMSAITPGADLSKVWPAFAIFLLTDENFGIIRTAKTTECTSAIQKVADLYAENRIVPIEEWRAAGDAATYAAEHAAGGAAGYAAAYAAEYAARAAEYAARAAGYAAGYSSYVGYADPSLRAAARAAGYAAGYSSYVGYADPSLRAAGYAAGYAARATHAAEYAAAYAEKLLQLLAAATE